MPIGAVVVLILCTLVSCETEVQTETVTELATITEKNTVTYTANPNTIISTITKTVTSNLSSNTSTTVTSTPSTTAESSIITEITPVDIEIELQSTSGVFTTVKDLSVGIQENKVIINGVIECASPSGNIIFVKGEFFDKTGAKIYESPEATFSLRYGDITEFTIEYITNNPATVKKCVVYVY